MKFLFAIALASLTCSAGAAGLSQDQQQRLCKLEDPVFLAKLPLILELKSQGVPVREVITIFMDAYSAYSMNSAFEYAKAIRPVFESQAKTVEEAIAAVEATCFAKLR